MISQFTKSLFDCAKGNRKGSPEKNDSSSLESHISIIPINSSTENQAPVLFEAFDQNISDIEGVNFQKQEFSSFTNNEFFPSSHEVDHKK